MIRFPTTEKQSRWRRCIYQQARLVLYPNGRVAVHIFGFLCTFSPLQTDKLAFPSACQIVYRCLALLAILHAASPFINQNTQTNGGSL
jgi:hypothetical protein